MRSAFGKQGIFFEISKRSERSELFKKVGQEINFTSDQREAYSRIVAEDKGFKSLSSSNRRFLVE